MNSSARRRALVLAQREFQTLVRTPTIWILAVGYLLVVLGLVVAAGTAGFLPLTLDLLTPVEVLVPILAFAFGYRSILADAERGELETLRTYPVSRSVFVSGIFVGRLAGLLAVVLVPLVLAGGFVVFGSTEQATLSAAHATVDSPAIYLRFLTLTTGFAVVTLAVATAVSAAARSNREALAFVAAIFLAMVVGFDASILAVLSGGLVGPDVVEPLVAFSPNSAFRGLVYGLAIGDVFTRGGVAGSPLLNGLGLLFWGIGSVGVAIKTVWSS